MVKLAVVAGGTPDGRDHGEVDVYGWDGSRFAASAPEGPSRQSTQIFTGDLIQAVRMVAPNMPVVSLPGGGRRVVSVKAMVAAIEQARQLDCRIVLIPAGSDRRLDGAALQPAVTEALAQGVLVVSVSQGPSQPIYPGALDHVLKAVAHPQLTPDRYLWVSEAATSEPWDRLGPCFLTAGSFPGCAPIHGGNGIAAALMAGRAAELLAVDETLSPIQLMERLVDGAESVLT